MSEQSRWDALVDAYSTTTGRDTRSVADVIREEAGPQWPQLLQAAGTFTTQALYQLKPPAAERANLS